MATVRKRNWTHNGVKKAAWVCEYTDRGGKRRRQTCPSKKAADAFRTRVETELRAGIHIAASASVTLAKAAEAYLKHQETKITAVTLANYETHWRLYLAPNLGGARMVDLTAAVIQQTIDRLVNQGRSIEGIHMARVVLAQILKFAVLRNYAGHNPMLDSPPEMPRRSDDRTKVPSKDELRAIFAAIDQNPAWNRTMKGRTRLILLLATLTGMRTGEIRALQWQNVDFENSEIKVCKAFDRYGKIKSTKSKAGKRDIPMAAILRQELREWKVSQPSNDEGWVFLTRFGKPFGQNDLRTLWTVALWYAGLTKGGDAAISSKVSFRRRYGRPKYHFHALRHVAASLWIEQRMPLKELATFIGHRTVRTTLDIYGHLMGGKDEALAAIDRAGSDLQLAR